MINFKKRLVISFLANCFRGGSTLLVGVLLARFLGSDDYGTLIFLIASSTAIKQFLDLGSSSAFFTFLSQETRSIKFVFQFWIFFFAKYLISILIILFILPVSWLTEIWLGNSSAVIIIALMAVAFQSDFWTAASQLLESQRKTVKVQILFVLAQIIHFVMIFELHYLEILTVTNYLIGLGLLWLLVGIIAVASYEPATFSSGRPHHLITLADYIKYCLPVAPIIMINFSGEFLDKWILQNWGGAKQQAFFAIAVQIASVSLLITASFIRIFWKEVAEALHKGNLQSAINLYLGVRKIIFYSGAFIAAVSIPWASEILSLLYGPSYVMAVTPLMLLMLYSIHQSMGQVDSAFLMASGKTQVGFKTSALLAPLGLLLSYYLISSKDGAMIGLGLGATGLAIKMVVSQLISVGAINCLIQKEYSLRIPYVYQFQVFAVLLSIGVLVKTLIEMMLPNLTLAFIFAIPLYCLLILAIALFFPKALALPTNWWQIAKDYLKTFAVY